MLRKPLELDNEKSLVLDLATIAKNRNMKGFQVMIPREIYTRPNFKNPFFSLILNTITHLARHNEEIALDFLEGYYWWVCSNPHLKESCLFDMLLAKIKGFAHGSHHASITELIWLYSNDDQQKKLFTAAIEGYISNKYLQTDQPNDEPLIYIFSFIKNPRSCEIFFETFVNMTGNNQDFDSLLNQSKVISQERKDRMTQLERISLNNHCTFSTACKMQHIISKYRITEGQAKYWPTLFILFYQFNPLSIKSGGSEYQVALPRELIIYIASFIVPEKYQDLTHLYVRMRLLATPKEMILAKDRNTILSNLATFNPITHSQELEIEKRYLPKPVYKNPNHSTFFLHLSEAVRDVADFILSCLNSCKSTKKSEHSKLPRK